MKHTLFPLLLILLAAHAAGSPAAAQTQGAIKHTGLSAAAEVLTNREVLKLVEAKLAPEVIVEKIKATTCRFDTSPAALQSLKGAGVPDSVLLSMVMSEARPRADVRVPPGTVVELETAHTINSQLFRKDDRVSFRVVNPVVVGGVVVIEKGATATAVLTKAERGGHFGRAGRLAWVMKEVTAVDGTRVPLEYDGRAVGDSKGAKVATRVAITGAVLLPIAPVALLHGFKRGGNAVVPEGKRFDAVVAAAGATVKVGAGR